MAKDNQPELESLEIRIKDQEAEECQKIHAMTSTTENEALPRPTKQPRPAPLQAITEAVSKKKDDANLTSNLDGKPRWALNYIHNIIGMSDIEHNK